MNGRAHMACIRRGDSRIARLPHGNPAVILSGAENPVEKWEYKNKGI